MNGSNGSCTTESPANSSPRADATLPPGSALTLDTIESLARKLEAVTVGEPREWAAEIARLAGTLIEQYAATAHRWAMSE